MQTHCGVMSSSAVFTAPSLMTCQEDNILHLFSSGLCHYGDALELLIWKPLVFLFETDLWRYCRFARRMKHKYFMRNQ